MRHRTGTVLLGCARRSVVVAVAVGLAFGSGALGASPAGAESSIANGGFSCAGAEVADARLTGLSVTPDVVLTGPGAFTVVFALAGDVAQPPVVTLASQDGTSSYAEAAVVDPAGWRADLPVADDAAPAELGVSIDWVDGHATTCTLSARGLPSVVAFHPTAPAAPTALTAAPRDAAVSLTWSPAADGLAPLTGYRVVAHPGGRVYDVADPGARGTLVRGLTDGVAYTFDVVALNAAGASTPVTSAPVVPRRLLHLTGILPASRVVTYGAASTVTATIRTASGAAAPGVPLELQARLLGTTSWVPVAHATSDSSGLVRLRAVLKGTSGLRLVHPADAGVLPTAAVGSVSVLARVTATPSRALAGAGYVQRVGGGVAPGGAIGSPVRLQRYLSGAWHTVASGSLTSATAYRVRWTPAHAGRYRLRVVRPTTGAIGTGVSPTFTVDAYDTRVSVAREVLADLGTHLATFHYSGVVDRADARHNITYTAAGLAARRSSYENAPGGSVMLDLRTLRLLRRIGLAASVNVSELAGGSHSPGSLHYAGRAIDISAVNGSEVRRGSGYWVVVRACEAAGATQVFYPAHDPYGGHQNHVHCAFA